MSSFANNNDNSDCLQENILEDAEAVAVEMDCCDDEPVVTNGYGSDSSDEDEVAFLAATKDTHSTSNSHIAVGFTDTVPHHSGDYPHTHVNPHAAVHHHKKTIYFIRHGLTIANEVENQYGWDSKIVRQRNDLWDTRLSETGRSHVQSVHQYYVEKNLLHREYPTLPTPLPGHGGSKRTVVPPTDIHFDEVEVVLASPLTRALQTAEYLLYGHLLRDISGMSDEHQKQFLLSPNVKKVAHPLLRECLYHCSEAGRSRKTLQEEFPAWDFSSLPEDEHTAWWYENTHEYHYEDENTGEMKKVSHRYPHNRYPLYPYEDRNAFQEPASVFEPRMDELQRYLSSRPERVMIVVTHWTVMMQLLGGDYRNCHVEKIQL